MHLWIDGQSLQTSSRLRGIGRYVTEFIRSMSTHCPDTRLSVSFNAAMPEEALAARALVRNWIAAPDIHIWHGVPDSGETVSGYSPNRRLSEIALTHHVACLAPDVALSASPFEGSADVAMPLAPLPIAGIPVASIFYDAIPYRFPDRYLPDQLSRDYYQRRLAFYRSFDLNLCISDYSKRECIHHTEAAAQQGPAPPCVNIQAGVSDAVLKALSEGKAAPVPVQGQYILYVGALDWRKNVGVVVDAIALLSPQQISRTKFVLCGDHHDAGCRELTERWSAAALPADNLVFLGHVGDDRLVSLYAHAALMVQPSLLEGFGLTALEAMVCGAPVIASNAGALPEVVQDPDLLFDPTQPSEIAAKMTRILENPDWAERARGQAYRRAGTFTWRKTVLTANDALLEVRARRSGSPVDLRQRRIITAGAAAGLSLPGRTIADALARAEPNAPQPPRLLIDVTATTQSDYKTGIQRVTKNISRELLAYDRVLFIYCDNDEGFIEVSYTDGRFTCLPERPVRFGCADVILMLDSSWLYPDEHSFALIKARLAGATVISCFYDTVPIRFQAMCHPGIPVIFARWLQVALAYSVAFVCISEAVADELIALLSGARFPARMEVGYWRLGADAMAALPVTVTWPVRKGPPRFLMVGTIEPRKGHKVAIGAFEALARKGIAAELVVVGKPGWGSTDTIERFQARDHEWLSWHKNVDDEQLALLYHDCDALIAASYTEGFGLPIAEAQHAGKHVIASDIPVFREVGGDARDIDFFETGSVQALTDAIEAFIRRRDTTAATPIDTRRQATASRTWAESAAELRALCMSGAWQKSYAPEPTAFPSPRLSLTMTRPLLGADRNHQIELIDGPIGVDYTTNIVFIVRVSNQSDKVWTSVGDQSDTFGVYLSYTLLREDGTRFAITPLKSSIALALLPGDRIYMTVEVPPAVKNTGAHFADIELMQEGVSWWGTPLRVLL